jgi:hypothetical protein
MSGPRSSRRPLRDEPRGAVTWVSLLMFVSVAAAAYLGWVWLPLWFDHYAVRQTVRAYSNEAIKNPDDAYLVHQMVEKIRSLRSEDGVDSMGRHVPVPAVVVEEHAVTWQRDLAATPQTLRVAFDYDRQVVYPFVGRTYVKTFTVDETNDIARADWGPQR